MSKSDPPSVQLRFYNRRQIAQMLGVTIRTIERMDARREIPGRRQFNARRVGYFVPAVDDWLNGKPKK